VKSSLLASCVLIVTVFHSIRYLRITWYIEGKSTITKMDVVLNISSGHRAVSTKCIVDGVVTIKTPKCEEKLPCLDIVGIFDESGSMHRVIEEMNALTNTIIECAAGQGGGTLTILYFASNIRVGLETTAIPRDNIDEWKISVAEKIGQFSTRGATNTNGIMMNAVDVISTLENQIVVFMATDGDPTTGDTIDVDEIAANVINARQDKKLDCGNFDFVVLGIGNDLSISNCETIGKGLHPDMRFIKTDMDTIAGDIGQFLGDRQMFPHAMITLSGCTALDPSQLELRNVKFDQLIEIPVQIDTPGESKATFSSFGYTTSNAITIPQEDKNALQTESMAPWICCRFRVNKLLKEYNTNNDEELLDAALLELIPFQTVDADKFRQLVDQSRTSVTEHAIYSQYQQLNELCRTSSEQATQAQMQYQYVYKKLSKRKRCSSTQPLAKKSRTHLKDEKQVTFPRVNSAPLGLPKIMSTLLAQNMDSATKLIATLNSNMAPHPPSALVQNIVVFSKSVGAYVVLHRNRKGLSCCDQTPTAFKWCVAVMKYRKPVTDLPHFSA
jgi:hypothetical protein